MIDKIKELPSVKRMKKSHDSDSLRAISAHKASRRGLVPVCTSQVSLDYAYGVTDRPAYYKLKLEWCVNEVRWLRSKGVRANVVIHKNGRHEVWRDKNHEKRLHPETDRRRRLD